MQIELRKVPLGFSYAEAMRVSIYTLGPAPLAVSFVRLIARVQFADLMSIHIKHDLYQVLPYCLFDMSYEEDYTILEGES